MSSIDAPPFTLVETGRRPRLSGQAAAIGNAEPRNHVEWLIDNKVMYQRLRQAIDSARHSIWISQLALDADCRFDHASVNGDETLLSALVRADSERSVSIRILLNASILLDTRKPLLRFIREKGYSLEHTQIRGMSDFPNLLHAKLIIIDGTEAFLPGSPLVNDYWDDSSHAAVDRHRPQRELSGRALHDVSLSLRGAALATLETTFIDWWNRSTVGNGCAETLPHKRRVSSQDSSEDKVSVVTTTPPESKGRNARGSTQNLDSLLNAIGNARSLIYIEHQYLSSRRIVSALADALERTPALDLVMVLNQNPDITAYQRWQNDRLRDSGLLQHERAGVFALWTVAHTGGKTTVNQIFVHSKVVVIDDSWALVGSANLDGVSLHSYGDDFSGRVARRVFRDIRNFEVGAVIRTRPNDNSPGSVAELRMRLWDEHLTNEVPRDHDQGLARWRAAASRNVHALRSAAAGDDSERRMTGHVLPYSTAMMPGDQLSAMGIETSSASLDLAFNPGWFSARFCPNWVRNMFL